MNRPLDPLTNPEITALLRRSAAGDKSAEGQLWDAIYKTLKRMANRSAAREFRTERLRPTELVNEFYLRISSGDAIEWKDRRHFFLVAARVIEHILVDTARHAIRVKRGENTRTAEFEDWMAFVEGKTEQILMINDALSALESEPNGSRIVEVVRLRFYGGFTEMEIGAILGVTERTVKRDWVVAKDFLRAFLTR